jgi:hypothetical protein
MKLKRCVDAHASGVDLIDERSVGWGRFGPPASLSGFERPILLRAAACGNPCVWQRINLRSAGWMAQVLGRWWPHKSKDQAGMLAGPHNGESCWFGGWPEYLERVRMACISNVLVASAVGKLCTQAARTL